MSTAYTETSDTRSRIVEAATRLYLSGGVDSLSMRAVAGEIGLSPMALYRHFPDKEALVAQLSAAALTRIEQRLTGLKARAPLAWLRACGEQLLDLSLQAPREFELAFLIAGQVADEAPASPLLSLVGERVQACIEQGQLRKAAPAEVALAFWAQCQGLLSLRRAGQVAGDEQAYRRTFRRSLDLLLAGLGAEARK
jgi:AcrR family transcriptional regulator